MDADRVLRPFLDRQGRLRSWPTRPQKRETALRYLAAIVDEGLTYTERQVNELLDQWHTFGDHTLLRRALCDMRLLARTPDGRRYWRSEPAAFGSMTTEG